MNSVNRCWHSVVRPNKKKVMCNTITKYLSIACVAVYAASGNVQAQEIQPIDCMIEPNIMVDISSPVDGVLDTVIVDRSDEGKNGEFRSTRIGSR